LATGGVAERLSRFVHGVDLAYWQTGSGPPVLLLHETATDADVWRPLANALAGDATVIAFDRRGWGRSGAPEPYARTTIEEQAEDAVGLLEQLGIEGALVGGAGLGAVAALDLLLRRPEMVRAAILVEPPLLAFLPDATEGLSADRKVIEQAVRDGGPPGALELYLGGALPFLGPGAERIPDAMSSVARERPLSLFAELASVAAWPIPTSRLAEAPAPSLVVVGTSTPAPLRRVADDLGARLGGAELLRLEGPGLPHVDLAAELATGLRTLLESTAARGTAGR
jgi:pimeloyl-ACP methyl ester carboxylesterase